MLAQRYTVTQLTADGDLVRIRLDASGGLRNDSGLNGVVGLRETRISWAMKARDARGLALGDVFTLTLAADDRRA